MDPVLSNTRLTSAGPRAPSADVACKAALLRQAWENASANKGVDAMRADLEALARKFPIQGGEALKSFNYLAALVADLQTDPKPLWLRTALDNKTPEYLSVQLLPTSIVVHISDETFRQITPGTIGVTLCSRNYPDDLRGRIILVPHPPQQRHEATLRHEIIHSLEAWEPANPFSCVYALKAIAEAKSSEQVSEQITLMRFFPRVRAQSEVVAYFGSEDPASSLEVYGGEEAQKYLDTVLKGLAFNPNLSREDKAGLYKRASEIYQESLLYAMALCVNFEDLRRRVGNETAVAQTLVRGHGDPDYSLVHRRADELCGRLDTLLGSLRTFGIIPWWRTTDWDTLATDLLKFPHPKVVPLVVEAIHRCSRPNLLRHLLNVFERAVELSPEPPQVDLDKLRQRLLQLTFSKAPLFHGYLKATAERLCRRLADGTLLMKPFDGQVLHPWLRIGKALDPKAPASELIHLLRDVYPNRDPVWDSTDFGALLKKAESMKPSEEIPLLVAIAEHAYQEHDITWSVIALGTLAKRGELANEHLTALRRIAPLLPPVAATTTGDEEVKRWYQESLMRFSEGGEESSKEESGRGNNKRWTIRSLLQGTLSSWTKSS